MRRIFLIVALLLALVDAGAQLKWKENSSFGWIKGESATFHKGKDMYGSRYTDRSAGTSYGFVGERNDQALRDYSRRRRYSAGADQWSSINAEDKTVARRNSGVWSESRPAGRAATRGNGRSLLNSDVWRTERHVAGGFNGDAEPTDYGRRVKPKGAPGNYNTPNAVGMRIGGRIKEMPVVGSNGDSGRRYLGQEDEGAAEEQYGFGEVPKDGVPVGDGVWLMALMAAAYAFVRRQKTESA